MSRARHLITSTPFRLAVTFTLLFLAVFVVSGALIYHVMNRNISEQLDESLLQTFGVISAAYGGDDLEDLISAVEGGVIHNPENNQVFGLFGPLGNRISGNISPVKIEPGYSSIAAEALGFSDKRRYRVFARSVGPNMLAIGYSYQGIDELRAVLLSGYVWTTLVAVLVAVSAGVFLAIRAQRRLDAIASTMNAVSHGQLDARIPLIGNDDDIDSVSKKVNAALERLGRLVEGMRQVSFDMAHDLKMPLNRLQIIIDEAAEKPPGSDLRPDLNEAFGEIERVNATFDALLRIAQIEAGARKARFTSVDLSTIVAELAETYKEVAADDGKALNFALPPTPSSITGDAELLTQLLANLIENALRHTASGTAIFVGFRPDLGSKTIIVEDNGPGIPEPEREKVFERLYRMDKSRTTPGSGLGLSLVKAIADLHDAGVILTDAMPGLRVTVRFP